MPASTATSVVPTQPVNYGALQQFISGIQGVASGGQASINWPCNNRIHRENFLCSGIAYGLAGAVTAVPTVADAGATFTVQTTNGQVTGITIVGAVSTKGNGTYALTITDHAYTTIDGRTIHIGQGATGTYTVSGSTVVSATAVTNPGTVAAIPAELFFNSFVHKVNGAIMRDISVLNVLKLAWANGQVVPDGGLPIFFTEPWRRIVDHDQATAWDLMDQSTYQTVMGIATGITAPTLVGTYEFDYLPNVRRGADGKPVKFLRPIKQHTFTFAAPGGVYPITSLPTDDPIQRMWLYENDNSTGLPIGKGSITQVELQQDGNLVIQATYQEYDQMLAQYGFDTAIFDFNAVFDPDQRLGKALNVKNLIFRVYSNAAATLNVVMEIQQDGYY